MRGWACRIRTGESVRELCDWNSLATLPEVVQVRRRRPFACGLRDTDLQLRPTFQQTIFRGADTAAPERRRTHRSMSILDLTRTSVLEGVPSWRAMFGPGLASEALGVRQSDPVHRLLMICE